MRGFLRQALAKLGLGTLVVLAVGPGAGPSDSLAGVPPDFEQLTLISELSYPTAMAWAPDGRLFVAEQDGRVRVASPQLVLQARPLLDISDHVNSYGDRGLLGIALDADFETNGFLYLLYTHEHDPTHQDGAKVARLSRITVRSDNTVENPEDPETIILGTSSEVQCPVLGELDCIPSEHVGHTIGTVRAGIDGTLWVGAGDATWPTDLDDPRLFRPYDVNSYAGKILHVDRNGHGLPGHPFCPGEEDLTKTCTKVYARGFRNPFRFSLSPDGGVAVGDVGWNEYEELNLITRGGNYGWPCYEGPIRTPGLEALARCEDEYAKEGGANAALPPIYAYENTGGASIIGAPTYQGALYPPAFQGEMFVGDTAHGWLRRLRPSSSGSVPQVTDFADGLDGWVVDLTTAPNGDLVYVTLSGDIRRIVYAPGNKTPIARAHASKQWGAMPLQVQFSSDGTSDPDGDALTFTWDFGDGSPGGSGLNAMHVYDAPGAYVASLTVSDAGGKEATAHVPIWAGNEPPALEIERVGGGSTYRAGERISLTGRASDPDEGPLGDAALGWEVTLRHRDHIHPLYRTRGPSTSFVVDDGHDSDSHYEVTLTAVDAEGLRVSKTLELHPETVDLTISSSPPGAPITYGGSPAKAPFHHAAAVGVRTTISAAESFSRDGRLYRFERWSDGGEIVHAITVPNQTTEFIAYYQDVTPAPFSLVEPVFAGRPVAASARLVSGVRDLAVRDGSVEVSVRCPAQQKARCRGRIQLDKKMRAVPGRRSFSTSENSRRVSLGRRSFSIPANSQRGVVVRLSARAKSLFRRNRLRARVIVMTTIGDATRMRRKFVVLRMPPRSVRAKDGRSVLLPIVFQADLRARPATIRLERDGAVLGRGRAQIEPGRLRAVRLSLTPSAQRVLRRRQRLLATVTIVTGTVAGADRRRAYRVLILR